MNGDFSLMRSYAQKLDAPIAQMLMKNEAQSRAWLHMPGHGGCAPFGTPWDTTELPSTDDLHDSLHAGAQGPYARAQDLAAQALGAKKVFFLTGGSTLGVLVMLLSGVGPGNEVILERSAHLSAYHGCALFDLTPHYVYPRVDHTNALARTDEDDILACMQAHPNAKAVLVTSPNYYGAQLDLSRLYKACKAQGMLLLVDGAHGAHLPFWCEEGAVKNADMATLSAHKTLPVLTMGAYLCLNTLEVSQRVQSALRMLMTSSPSSLICAQLDLARAFLQSAEGQHLIAVQREHLECLRRCCPMPFYDAHAYFAQHTDPARLVIDVRGGGTSGWAMERVLLQQGIDIEMADCYRLVCITNPFTPWHDFQRLLTALEENVPSGSVRPYTAPMTECRQAQRLLSVHRAAFAQGTLLPVARAINRISTVCAGVYPPGVPLLAPGEQVTKEIASVLSNSAKQGARLFGVETDPTISEPMLRVLDSANEI